MLYSKNSEELLRKVNFLLKDLKYEKYHSGLREWLSWFKNLNPDLPNLKDPFFYRSFVGQDNVFGIQIWTRNETTGINLWHFNFIMNGYHENNSEFTQIISK